MAQDVRGLGEERSVTDGKGKQAKPEGARRAEFSAADAAKQLRVSEDRLSQLFLQGRLEARGEDEDRRYGAESVLRLRAEDLLRGILERAKDRCPEICADAEELASIQFARGQLARNAAMRETLVSLRHEPA